jgi:hypothetical protein
MVSEQRIISVREVINELKRYEYEDRLSKWAKSNSSLFHQPTPEELSFVTEIFKVKHFQTLIRKKEGQRAACCRSFCNCESQGTRRVRSNPRTT